MQETISLYLDRMDGVLGDRREIVVTKGEYKAYRAIPRESDLTTIVLDQKAGEYVAVAKDACGGGCKCAAQGFTLI